VPFAKRIGGHARCHGRAAEYHQGRDRSRAEKISVMEPTTIAAVKAMETLGYVSRQQTTPRA
jgi:hypothetical protein